MDDIVFDLADRVVFAHEGGYGNEKRDPGGPTAYGITLTWLRQFEPHSSLADIRALTRETARAKYKEYLWDRGPFAQLTSPAITVKVYDMAIQFGESVATGPGHEHANALIQRAANLLGAGLSVDGCLGPLSLAAINALDPKALASAACLEMRMRYLASVMRDPTMQYAWDGGWHTRAPCSLYTPCRECRNAGIRLP